MLTLVRTPLRISFFGGGTDLREYYQKDFGAVLSTTINKYVYLAIKPQPYANHYRLAYRQNEFAETPEEINHPIVREAVKKLGIKPGIEIFTWADIPSHGTGLGSSSSFTTGLLHGLYNYSGLQTSKEQLAQEACEIEIELLKEPIGKQDQYAASYGGLNFIQFNADETTKVQQINLSEEKTLELQSKLMLFYTGLTRKASEVLSEQKSATISKIESLDKMREMAIIGKKELEVGNIEIVGELLDEAWQIKKQLASKISNPEIDDMYSKAMNAGAIGGKILGAGGGGFLLLYCDEEKQQDVRTALAGFHEEAIKFEESGSQITNSEIMNWTQ